MTTITHPVLKGHSVGVARRRLTFLGVSTPAMWTLAAVVVVLNMIGLIMVMSASSVDSVRVDNTPWSLFTDQVIWTAVGLVALVAAMMVSVDFWRRIRWVLLGISLAGLVAVLVPGVGVEVNGATRWVALGGFQFQPSEAAKFALLIFVADLLARREHRVHDWRWALGPTLAYVVLVGGLIMLQPNLGTTMIIVATTMAVLWAAGVPGRSMALTGVGFALAGAVFMVIERFRTRRFLMFLDPRKDPTGDGLQNVQSFIAIANGGLWGRGLGNSTVKWGFLPYAWTDFIFAVIAEEFGFVGAMAVVVLFVLLAAVGVYIASQASDRFSMLLAVGITAWITAQAFLNIAAVVSLVPITGVPLPFISVGGSAMVVNLAAVGLLANIARHPANPSTAGAGLRRPGTRAGR